MSEQIKEAVKLAKKNIIEAERMLGIACFELEKIQYDCPHQHTEQWTNDDGDGSFMVERCLDCGLQRDGGLPKWYH